MGDKIRRWTAPRPPGADIELSDRKPKSTSDDDAFDVRVLDVKKAGAPTIIRVPKNGTCADLRTAVRAPSRTPRPTGSDSSATAGRSATAYCRNLTSCHAHHRATIHLTVRPEGTQASTPSANEVPYDVSALVAAVAANPLPSDPAARARFHVARTGARACGCYLPSSRCTARWLL